VNKSGRIREVGHLAHMGRLENVQDFGGETRRKETTLEIWRLGNIKVDVNRSRMGGNGLD
jgi:hypothetical protein